MRDVEILADTDDFWVINKPTGCLTHPDGRSTEWTLVDWVLERGPDIALVGEPWEGPDGRVLPRPGIVHRLDKDTTGVLVIAKNQETYLWLKEQFRERQMDKEYRAFVHGVIVETTGVIDKPIGKSPADFRKFSAQRGARGVMRDARTRFTVLSRITHNTHGFADWNSNGYSYIAMFPETGRTHQLRVHMKAIHHPIVSDPLYAGALGTGLGCETIALHAHKIKFTLKDGTEVRFTAPLPEQFTRIVA
jgi:23S rRNA pseudouridine1911/1915/1917 synthase